MLRCPAEVFALVPFICIFSLLPPSPWVLSLWTELAPPHRKALLLCPFLQEVPHPQPSPTPIFFFFKFI